MEVWGFFVYSIFQFSRCLLKKGGTMGIIIREMGINVPVDFQQPFSSNSCIIASSSGPKGIETNKNMGRLLVGLEAIFYILSSFR